MCTLENLAFFKVRPRGVSPGKNFSCSEAGNSLLSGFGRLILASPALNLQACDGSTDRRFDGLTPATATPCARRIDPVMDKFPPSLQRPALLEFAQALNSRPSALRRDECGDWRINGRFGHVYAVPGAFQILFFAREGVTDWDGAGPHIEDFVRAKHALVFCRLAQDGTGEGIFVLDRLLPPRRPRSFATSWASSGASSIATKCWRPSASRGVCWQKPPAAREIEISGSG
jgi:hypothetical protein